jgi:hypothetical protein
MSNMVLGILKKPLIKYRTKILSLIGGSNMNSLTMMHGAEPRAVLLAVIQEKIPAIMSYLSGGKWHVAKVLLTNLGANRLEVSLLPREASASGETSLKSAPAGYTTPHEASYGGVGRLNIQVNQPVGISLKYGYGKFIFETTVTALGSSPDSTGGETFSLLVPDRIEIVQRRSYFRVNVPGSLKVNVMLWHRRCTDDASSDAGRKPPEYYWQGRLADISAGGVQLVVDNEQKPDFKKGQFVGLRFTPLPYEMPLMFNAQIRNILPTANQKCICLGLQIVGLEASPEGREILRRLCNIVERYYQMNQSSAQPAPQTAQLAQED